MVAYVDSSTVLRYVLNGEIQIQHALALPSVVSSELLNIECQRALHRCRLTGELDDDSLVEAYSKLAEVMLGITLLELTKPIKARAAETFPLPVKTLDALHLATLLIYKKALPVEELLLFSHDKGMNQCGLALGFTTPLLAADLRG